MNVTPFAQVVAGAARFAASSDLFAIEDSETKGMVQLGGGVAGPINPKLDWLAQFDYRRVFSESGTNAIRFVAGVRLKLK